MFYAVSNGKEKRNHKKTQQESANKDDHHSDGTPD